MSKYVSTTETTPYCPFAHCLLTRELLESECEYGHDEEERVEGGEAGQQVREGEPVLRRPQQPPAPVLRATQGRRRLKGERPQTPLLQDYWSFKVIVDRKRIFVLLQKAKREYIKNISCHQNNQKKLFLPRDFLLVGIFFSFYFIGA